MSAPARLQAVPLRRFDELLRDVEAAARALAVDEIVEALGVLERARVRLLLRATGAAGAPRPVAEELLTVRAAATRLAMSEGQLYRLAPSLPFTVRHGRSVRFSARGVDAYIRARQGC
jgi:predicted DNA-binding transcriptional regulator AlpA